MATTLIRVSFGTAGTVYLLPETKQLKKVNDHMTANGLAVSAVEYIETDNQSYMSNASYNEVPDNPLQILL